jgi:hypothetical protein
MSNHNLAKCPRDHFFVFYLQIVGKIEKNIFWDLDSKLKLNYFLTIPLNQHIRSFIRRDKLKYRGLRDKETEGIILLFSDPFAVVSCPYFCPSRVPFYASKINGFYSIS